MSDPNDNSIPILQEVLVPGHAAQRREPQSGAAPATSPAATSVPSATTPAAPVSPAGAPASTSAAPASTSAARPADTPLRASEELREPGLQAEPELAPQPVLSPEDTLAPEPVLAPEPAAVPGRPTIHSDDAHRAEEAEHAHDEVLAASAGVFDRTEPPPPLEAGATVPPDIAQEGGEELPRGVNAELIAGRLRERFAGFLAGDGLTIVEARCRSAVEEHTTRLVDQITREVVSTLEKEMTGWVREAVEAEVARRTSGA
ncbi:DUF2486 family protein [Paraburkholderia phenoliruptrix]|uniref:DUF2486 family protein n=1 Tax=Paraburkholderia phenoliruptrix TaxID=252970 RepID=A0ABV3WB42_9BURK|nr:DUF2486 family protein [Paraburkholderia phenoliruptrix]MDR6388480.1 hypothetical protein [Paraburkholderia phenoliruptrix]